MDAKVEGLYVKVHLGAIFDALSAEDKAALVDLLSCEDDIIKNVSAQIISGWTELGSHGGVDVPVSPDPHAPLNKATREVAKMSGEVAKREIERLEAALARSKQRESETSSWAWKMYHAWPDGYFNQMPKREVA